MSRDLIALIDGYFDGALTAEQEALLCASIKQSRANARLVAERAFLHCRLREALHRRDLQRLLGPGDRDEPSNDDIFYDADIMHEVVRQAEISAERRAVTSDDRQEHAYEERSFTALYPRTEKLVPVRHIVIPRAVVAAGLGAVLAVLLLVVYTWLEDDANPAAIPQVAVEDGQAMDNPSASVAHLVRQVGLNWSAPGISYDAGAALTPGRIELTHGLAEVALKQGARVTIAAPATIVLRHDNALELETGRIIAYVPDTASGFTVHTPVSQVIDIGTEFGVEVEDGGRTNVIVLKGEADVVSEDSHAAGLRLTTGQAGAVAYRGDAPQRTAMETERFAMPLQWRQGIVRMAGNVSFEGVAPPSLSAHDHVSAHAIRMIQERSSITLTEDLTVTFTEPGRHEIFAGREALVPAGTTATVYIFHYNPPAGEVPAGYSLSGSVTFERPVLGVIAVGEQLNATDGLLGAEHTEYGYPPGGSSRGMERINDYIHLSEDRRSIEFLCHGGRYVDQFRVLVANE